MSLLVQAILASAAAARVLERPTLLEASARRGQSPLDRFVFGWIPPFDPSDNECGAGVGFDGARLLSGGSLQTAFRLQAFDDRSLDGPPLFESGKIVSDRSARVHLEGLDAAVRRDPAARAIFWRVKSWVGAGCESEWSDPVMLAVAPTGFAAAAKALWLGGSGSQQGPTYALMRKEFPIDPSKVTSATVMVAASQDTAEKLLGAYRLSVNGQVAGIGPGRGDTAIGAENHTMFDTIDVTAMVKAGTGTVALGLQGYSRVQGNLVLQCVVVLAGGADPVTVVTDSSWKAHNATDYFGPTGATGGYKAPQEHIVAANYPGDWTAAGFDDSGWAAATETEGFGYAMKAKETLPINFTPGVVPPVLQQLPGGFNGYFFDFETDVMAGITLTVPHTSFAAAGFGFIEVTLSEELDGPYGSGALLYPMRTGNKYRYIWTLDPAKDSFFEIHEYALFRYGTLYFCATLDKDGGCPNPSPSPNPPQPHPPAPPPGPVGMCVSAAENTKASLGCPAGETIAGVSFASYGTATGACSGPANTTGANTFKVGKCNADNSASVLAKLCVGKSRCSIEVTNGDFKGCGGCLPDGDPCHETDKSFDAAVTCTKTPEFTAAVPKLGGPAAPFSLSAWVVKYPWNESDSWFSSSDPMLDAVYGLCRNTLKVTSLDTTTDSNTRERLPYEADGYITGNSRFGLQREQNWQLHSTRHNYFNPTWPTEWRQIMPLMAHDHWMQTGELTLAREFWDMLVNSTQLNCVNSTNSLVDFSHCTRMPGTRDIVDWPMDARDHYSMTDTNTVINAFTVGGLRALAEMATAMGEGAKAASLTAQANATQASMERLLFNATSGLMVDGLYGAEHHSAWHAQTNSLWFETVPPAAKPKMLAWLLGRRVVGSVYAVYSFLQALYAVDSDHGVAGLAMMTQCDDNSWCHMLKVNATATMEAWTRGEKPNLSWSHPWASAPATAIVRGLIGLMPVAPGFRTWKVKPQPGNLTHFSSRSPALPGFFQIDVVQAPGSFSLTIGAPANTHGTVCVPKLGSSSTTITVDGKPSVGYAESDYICIDGIAGSQTPHVVTRSA